MGRLLNLMQVTIFFIISGLLSFLVYVFMLENRAQFEGDEDHSKPIALSAQLNKGIASIKKASEKISIAVISPASGVQASELAALKDTFPHVRFPVQLDPQEERPPFHSASDDRRAQELSEALFDSSVNVLWGLRGGYGNVRAMQDLIKSPAPKKPKLIVGYSDMTALHLLVNRWGWPSLHAPVQYEIFNTKKDPENWLALSSLLLGESGVIQYGPWQPMNAKARAMEAIQGNIIGGNLTLLSNSLGTPWQLQAKGQFVFIEDVHLKGYALDRTLLHLKQAGVLNNIKGVLFGSFQMGDDWVDYALDRFAQEASFPVFKSDLFGHGEKNRPLPFGCPATLAKTPEGIILSIETTRLSNIIKKSS